MTLHNSNTINSNAHFEHINTKIISKKKVMPSQVIDNASLLKIKDYEKKLKLTNNTIFYIYKFQSSNKSKSYSLKYGR